MFYSFIRIVALHWSATDHTFSEGNDILPVPSFDNKNAYLNRKWPNFSAIPYAIDSTFGNNVDICI